MTIVTIPNDYRRESGQERIDRFNEMAEAEYAKSICRMCGAKLDERGHCPHGCLDNSVVSVILAAYSKPVQQYKPVVRCPECFCEVGHCEHTEPIEGMSAEHIRNGEA